MTSLLDRISLEQLSELKDVSKALTLIQKDGQDYSAPTSALVLSQNNLSDVDPTAARLNLDTYSTKEMATDGASSHLGYMISMALSGNNIGAKLNNMVLVEDFKNLVTADGDWADAIQAALNYAFNNGFNIVRGYRPMQVSKPITIIGWGKGLDFSLGFLTAHDRYVAYTDWKKANALIVIGDTSANGGSMVGLNVRVQYMESNMKCNGINIIGKGAGGSRFHIGRATAMNIMYDCHQQNWPAASNFITGDYWYSGNMGTMLARGTGTDTPIAEGHKICVGFVTEMKYGGHVIRDGGQYCQISGDADFSGRYLSELTIAGNSFDGLVRGAQLTNGTTSCEILAFYQQTSGVYKVLVIEAMDVSGGKSSYKAGDVLTSGAWTSTCSKAYTAQQDKMFFFDVILDFNGSPFSKCDVGMGYLGGLVGDALHSSVIAYHNSYSATTYSVCGAQWFHSGTTLTLKDTFLDKQIFDATANFIAPWSPLYLRDLRAYGIEMAIVMVNGKATTWRRFAYQGLWNVQGQKDVYEVVVMGPIGTNGACFSFKVAVDPNGIEVFENTLLSTTPITIATSGMDLVVTQNFGADAQIYVVYNRK